MVLENLQFKNKNPGSVQYGNFINYYQFHPAETRLELLPTNIWDILQSKEELQCLDVGCNSGDLTIVLHNFLTSNVCKNCKIIGVDIDPILVQRAREKNCNDNISFETLDFLDSMKRKELLDKFLIGSKLNVTFCFSITMWIHLNHGDDGLQQFLKDVCNLSDVVVVEPQPWKCYKTAAKRLKSGNEKFPYFDGLNYKENVEAFIEETIIKQGAKKVFESERTKWRRKIVIFNCSSCRNT